MSDDDYININESFIKNEGTKNERIFDVNENLSQLISSISNSKSVTKFEVSPNILRILDSKSEKSAQGTLKKLSEKIDSDDFDKEEVKKPLRMLKRNFLT